MPKRKPTTYNKILREFTKLNNKLPEDRKLSISQRREIIKTQILPKYKKIKPYQVRVKKLRKLIIRQIDKVPPKELCDLNYLDPSEYAWIEWFAIDETIRELIPNCVYIKVTAGKYGETKIFNTRNYSYGAKGVRKIVENIRPDANNDSGNFIFSGYQKLRPRKKNNGNPENYYLDFILFRITKKGEESFGDAFSERFELPKTREVRKKKTRVKHIIEDRLKNLQAVRNKKKRAKRTLAKNVEKMKVFYKEFKKSKNPSPQERRLVAKQLTHTINLIEKYKSKELLTDYQYGKAVKDVFKDI